MALEVLDFGNSRGFADASLRALPLLIIFCHFRAATIAIIALITMRKTYAAVILNHKAAHLRKETGNIALVSKWDTGFTSAALFK